MSERTHLLVQQWLQQALPHASTDELKDLSEQHPYFSAAHLLLYQRLQNNDGASIKNKAALHVYNPLSLEIIDAGEMFHFPFEQDAPAEEAPALLEPQKENETFFSAPETVMTSTIEQPENEEMFEDEATETIAEEPLEISQPNSEKDSVEAVDEATVTDETDNTPEPTEGGQEVPLPKFNLNVNAPAGDITFEPFHTVDYFASQGIKLSQAEAPTDKFGKQLKSFTEWLKTMKKLPATAVTANTDNAGEKKVENLAAHSLQSAEIITESMAEVWVKQGNWQKASEVYNKLSLQNPSKKAYFAAKIESLKKPS